MTAGEPREGGETKNEANMALKKTVNPTGRDNSVAGFTPQDSTGGKLSQQETVVYGYSETKNAFAAEDDWGQAD